MELKICKTCRESKSLSKFHRYKKGEEARRPHCAECRAIKQAKENSPEHLERLLLRREDKKRCPSCDNVKLFSEFSKSPSRYDGIHGYCKECRKVKDKSRRDSNPEKVRSDTKMRMRKWRQNPENAEKGRIWAREYSKKNRSRCSDRQRNYRKTKSGRKKLLLQLQRRRDRESSVESMLKDWHIELLLNFQHRRCARCDRIFSENLKYTLDHIIPLSLGGKLVLENVQLLCRSCNSSKGINDTMYRKSYNDHMAIVS